MKDPSLLFGERCSSEKGSHCALRAKRAAHLKGARSRSALQCPSCASQRCCSSCLRGNLTSLFSDLQQPLWTKGALCVNVHSFALSTASIHRHLHSSAQLKS